MSNKYIVEAVLALKKRRVNTWRNKPDSYWFARLVQEVGELGSALVGDHEGPTEWELMQIATICINWLEHIDPKEMPLGPAQAEGES